MAYPSVCVKNLPTLAQVMKKGASVGPFLIMLICDFVVKVTRGGRRKLELKLSVDLPVLRTTQEKQDFQQACAHDSEATQFVDQLATNGAHHYHGPFPFRWASGGYLPIFVIEEVRYCMLFLDRKSVV